jgi:hypothetical protein
MPSTKAGHGTVPVGAKFLHHPGVKHSNLLFTALATSILPLSGEAGNMSSLPVRSLHQGLSIATEHISLMLTVGVTIIVYIQSFGKNFQPSHHAKFVLALRTS